MSKLVRVLVLLCLVFPSMTNAEMNTDGIKMAFIKDGFLWLMESGKEEKLVELKATDNYAPQWSFDGKMLLYQKEVAGSIYESQKTSNELWVYDTETKKHRKIFYDGSNPKWSPIENIVAFNQGGTLNISDLNGFHNVALGVDSYEWMPDGKGFIASSSASLRPDGWTSPTLFTISIKEGYRNLDLTKHDNVTELFVIPKEIGIDNVTIPSISAESFTFSPDGKWISFIVTPWASWSMDSDMLCVISVDGKKFEVLDEVILQFKPKWAYQKNHLGYIAGGGRIVFGFKNKDLKVTELPATNTLNLTPDNYAEMGFTWVDDASLIVSRVKESEWSNDPEQRPVPSLYFLTLGGDKQVKITSPPKLVGDYDPIFLPSINKITWLRSSEFPSAKSDLWIADPNGEHAEIWVEDIDLYSYYPTK